MDVKHQPKQNKISYVINKDASQADVWLKFFLFQLALFPDVELNFLQDLALQHTGPYAVNNICNVLLEDQYPKAIAVPKATATATATVPNPEPDPVSLQKNRYCRVPKFSDKENFATIYLKIKQRGKTF